jgi:hypothetical protein
MNRLSLARHTQIMGASVEGDWIRPTERMTDTHWDAVVRLPVEVWTRCRTLLDAEMRNLLCWRIQVD